MSVTKDRSALLLATTLAVGAGLALSYGAYRYFKKDKFKGNVRHISTA
jgi:hypothetical protein